MGCGEREGGVLVVWGRRVVGGPVLEEHVPSAGSEGPVCSSHEFWWGNFHPGWGGGRVEQEEGAIALLVVAG